jgi:hypothetical protein
MSSSLYGIGQRLIIAVFAFAQFANLARGQETAAVPVKITIDPAVKLAHIPEEFIGFGYETSAVAQMNFFDPSNKAMVRLYRNLTPHGLIRIGGNVSDHTRYVRNDLPHVADDHGLTVIDRANLRELASFAKSTGWSVMWGLNLGTGTKEEAVEEAVAVDQELGTSLQSFQIGNEVDYLPRFKRDYARYHAAFAEYKSAIRATLPHAVFSGPDVAGSLPYFQKFLADESGDMLLATHHYYRADQSSPKATIDYLLAHDDGFDRRLDQLRTACDARHVGYRINEVNSFSGGGKPGVSDTFASALWVLDYTLDLASHGCAGVNIETDINHHAFVSSYSPIVHDADMVCSARPEYYGLLAFAMAGHGDVIKTTLDKPADLNLSAYTTLDSNHVLWVVVINKDLTRDAAVEASHPLGAVRWAEAFRLAAPAIDSKTGATFAGSTVGKDGSWKSEAGESVEMPTPQSLRLTVPHASAVVVKLTPGSAAAKL